MATKRTLVRADPDEHDVVQIRFTEQTLNDAGEVIATRHHRTSVEPGASLNAIMPHVQHHMAQVGFTPAPVERVASLGELIAKVHTPERVAKFKAERELATPKSGGGPGEEK